ncbi:MAG TPA: glycosyltransferase family 4 protein [Allosphingosinicella sp.]|nr:glycosyltransferase family 4 protein [Allosphingosinicella sp.]
MSRIALIGNALPRRCGLATYTSHVFEALRDRYPALKVDYYAMNDPGGWYDYPSSVTGVIREEALDDYLRTARRIEASGAELVWVQHEFGIFGGPAGSRLLPLLERLTVPIAIALHSVLDQPSADQRAVMDRLIRLSDRLIVMAEKGRSILRAVYGAPDHKIAVIPHGVPDRPYCPPALAKPAFGLAGRKVLLTFGLLSPNKGIETMIEAMPAILADHPDTDYVIAGATHPHLLARDGELYRNSLKRRAERLGVGARLRWIDRFLDQESLLDLIAAADIYVTPYLDLTQITSGTLSYAVALGKPVVSTPYHHAAEIIGPDNGILADAGDADAFAAAVSRLLGDDALRERMARNAYGRGRAMVWRRNVEATMAEFAACLRAPFATETAAAGPLEACAN